jgi:hypothetical protein
MEPAPDPNAKSPACLLEREKLPPELRPDFDSLVAMYRYYALVHHKQAFVSYKVLADLIREGWRLTETPKP